MEESGSAMQSLPSKPTNSNSQTFSDTQLENKAKENCLLVEEMGWNSPSKYLNRNWRRIGETSDAKLDYISHLGSSYGCYRLTGLLKNCKAKDVFDLLWNLKNFSQTCFTQSLLDYKQLYQCTNSDTAFFMFHHKLPNIIGIAKRDYSVVRGYSKTVTEEMERYTISESSLEWIARAPIEFDYIRTTIHIMGYSLQQKENDTEMVYIVQLDPRGIIPRPIIKHVEGLLLHHVEQLQQLLAIK